MPHPFSNTAYDAAQFERPSVTADIVVFSVRDRQLQVLLVRRKEWPFQDFWALPGGFVRPDETPDAAARRELAEETGVHNAFLEQGRVFGEPGRDPRTWVITIAYTALMPSDTLVLRAGTDAADAQWFPLAELPAPLAFDHAQILDFAAARLRERAGRESRLLQELLPARFSLSQMQDVSEILLGSPMDKRNFRKWALGTGQIAPSGEAQRGPHRPALLYQFVPETDSPSALLPPQKNSFSHSV